MNKYFFVLAIMFFTSIAEAKVIDRIVAVVNDEVITLSELNDAVAARKQYLSEPEEHNRILNELIDDIIFDKELKESNIEVADEDLTRAIQNVLLQNRMSLDQLKQELAAKGVAYSQYRKQLEREIRKIKFVNQVIGPQVKISDQDLRDYYQRHQERFRGSREAHISQLATPIDSVQTQEEFDALFEKNMKIAQEAAKGKHAAEFHDLGMVDLSTLPPLVAQTVRSLEVGETSRPIPTPNGIFIIKLISLPKLSADDFERLRDNIYNALYDERVEERLNGYLLQQRRKSFIDIR